jgi:hypothetical protein
LLEILVAPTLFRSQGYDCGVTDANAVTNQNLSFTGGRPC